jgi:hypothetical protein
MCIPFGTYRNAARSGDLAAGAADARGVIASSHGSATAAPRPLSMVRREIDGVMESFSPQNLWTRPVVGR